MTQFIGLPFVQFFNFHILKSRLVKEGYKIDDPIRNNLKTVFYAITVCAVMMVLAGLVMNIILPR